ncbi:MAG: hydrolase [Oscillospiraceae bacterium]|jgi:nicotinamidase-related amidase|nr:hydrolase [Oscillospiraceae bacterium]
MRAYQNSLLDPSQVAVCLIDQEPQMFFGVEGASRNAILNAVTGLAKTARAFNIPIILSTVEAQTFSGPLAGRVQAVFPDVVPVDRTTLNAWEDANFRKSVERTARKKLLLSGLWTEVCVTLPALSAMEDGYEIYVVADACGGSSRAAHQIALQRMIQAGVKPLTWQAALLELQRDWANKDTYQAVMTIIGEHGGAYGLGLEYAQALVPASQQQ